MSEEVKNSGEEETEPSKKENLGRRDILKGLATIPVFGVFFYKLLKKKSFDDDKKKAILAELGISGKAPVVPPETTMKKPGELIRLGIIGFGGRGEALTRASGFAHPGWIERKKKDTEKNKLDKGLEVFLTQENLNVLITGICDVFDVRAERGTTVSRNDVRPGGGSGIPGNGAKRYLHYQDLLKSNDIDAVIIATPDHWHAPMVIDAVNAGKHVYCEKCMTRTEEEVYKMVNAVKKSGMVFQLGHQNRHTESHLKAKEIIDKNILGKITLVEATTNRNSPGGAWVYNIHEEGNPETIDWEQFIGPAPKKPFSLEHFFRWRCWFDYGTGLSGDLLSHEYDAVNQILELGVPQSVVASGGIYFFKDGRDVPDVFQVVCEYPERDLTLIYSATLASGRGRGRVFMGHDASMEVGGGLTVTADYNSTRYKNKIKDGIIDTSLPLFSYRPGSKGIDAVTSATEKYFASRGLIYTYRGGKRVDVTHLHIKEWLDCIRNGGQTSCNIDRGFEEAITCHMATTSYLKGRKVEWDHENKRIV